MEASPLLGSANFEQVFVVLRERRIMVRSSCAAALMGSVGQMVAFVKLHGQGTSILCCWWPFVGQLHFLECAVWSFVVAFALLHLPEPQRLFVTQGH